MSFSRGHRANDTGNILFGLSMIPSAVRPSPSSCGPMNRGCIAAAREGEQQDAQFRGDEMAEAGVPVLTLPSLVARLAMLNNVPVAPKQAVKRPGQSGMKKMCELPAVPPVSLGGPVALTERNQGFPGDRHFFVCASVFVVVKRCCSWNVSGQLSATLVNSGSTATWKMSRLIGRGALLRAGSVFC